MIRAARLGRSLLLLASLGGVGQGQASPQVPIRVQAPSDETRIQRLRSLVEAAEQDLKDQNLDRAAERCEEADVVMADWSAALLQRQEVVVLLERLKAVQSALEDEEGEEQTGLKMKEEVVTLTGEDLRAELSRVEAAEAGVTFDFPIDLNDKVLTWIHLFSTSKRGFMEGSLARGTRYLPMIRQIFAEEGVPQDMAFLALPESGFTNKARSRAKAVGMWQFIRATGRIYGLETNAWVDERCDPVKAARAAARYLKRMYETRGDWYLALAGYNAGPLTVDRAATALGTQNYWDMVRSRYLRTETKNYVPQILAAIIMGKNPEKYGLRVPQMSPYAYETVEVDKMTSLQVLARFADTDVESLRDLNPELLRGSTPPGKYELRVPPGQGLAMMRALARIPTNKRLDFKTYVVRKGDTVAKVAARFKVSGADLLSTNGLAASQFKVGLRLKVPPPPTTPVDARDLMPAEAREKILSEKPLEALPVIPSIPATDRVVLPAAAPALEAPKATLPAPRPKFHVAKRGETLFSIAEQHGVEVADLKKWNKLKTDRISAGQKLKLQK